MRTSLTIASGVAGKPPDLRFTADFQQGVRVGAGGHLVALVVQKSPTDSRIACLSSTKTTQFVSFQEFLDLVFDRSLFIESFSFVSLFLSLLALEKVFVVVVLVVLYL
jgi:hypothetical protein